MNFNRPVTERCDYWISETKQCDKKKRIKYDGKEFCRNHYELIKDINELFNN